jgi:hypothetical protein
VKKPQAIKFWKALNDSDNVGGIISKFENKKGVSWEAYSVALGSTERRPPARAIIAGDCQKHWLDARGR